MTTVYERLNINTNLYENKIIDFPKEVTDTLNVIPPLLTTWQKQDIGNNVVSGYFVNPVANVAINVRDAANSIVTTCTGVTGLSTIVAAATLLSGNSVNFIGHTNRISGVDDITPATATLPHYSTGIAIGKGMVNIVYQTDKIANNAPLLGCFSSLFVANTLANCYITLVLDEVTIQNSISISGLPPTATSNLSAPKIAQITSNVLSALSSMDTPRIHDETFFITSKTILDDYKVVKSFTSIGETENYLLKNHVGSTKLLSRI